MENTSETAAVTVCDTPAQVPDALYLRGERVVLRPVTYADTEAIVGWRNDPAVQRHFVFRAPFTTALHETWLREQVATGRCVQYMICVKDGENGGCVGHGDGSSGTAAVGHRDGSSGTAQAGAGHGDGSFGSAPVSAESKEPSPWPAPACAVPEEPSLCPTAAVPEEPSPWPPRPLSPPQGTVYLRDIDRRENTAEFGILIGEACARGKGIAHEVLSLILAYGFDVLGLERIGLRVYTDNLPALRAYTRAGFRTVKTLEKVTSTDGEEKDMYWMEVTKASCC